MLMMKDVSKTFNPGTVNEKTALRNLNLELADGDEAEVTVCGARALCFRAVAVRVSPAFVPRLHIDYDEANACRFRPGMVGFVKKRKEDVHDLG